MKKRALTIPLFVGAFAMVAASLFIFADSDASAQRRLRARVFVTQHRIPNRLSERGLIGFARRHRARRMQERTDLPVAERRWEANMVVAFNRPIGDMQFTAVFYQTVDGARRFVAPSLDIMINGRNEKTFVQRIRLERPAFKVNERTEVVITVRRREVGRARFDLLGERVRHSGEVNF